MTGRFLLLLAIGLLFTSCLSPKSSSPLDSPYQSDHADGSVPARNGNRTGESGSAGALDDIVSQPNIQVQSEQINSYISNGLPAEYYPVFSRGVPVYTWTSRQNGTFVYLLCVERKPETRMSELNFWSEQNLYSEEAEDFRFFLLFLQIEDTVPVLKQNLDLGVWRAVKNFNRLDITKEKTSETMILNVAFFDLNGFIQKIITIDTLKYSMLNFENSSQMHSDLKDIDKDGIIDILQYETYMEEGTGVETFLTWYKWSGNGFRIYGNTNIVRNLNSFLWNSAMYMSKGQWERLYRYGLSSREYARYQNSAVQGVQAFSLIFQSNNPSDRMFFQDGESVKEAAFPELFENPFPSGENSFTIPLRIRSSRDYLYSGTVVMNDNPFVSPQFYFKLTN